MTEENHYTFPAVGVMRSCYKAKFGIPRQPGLIEEATGAIELLPPYNQPNTVRGLEDFSHIWVLFVFHQALRDGWKATVRPPRLGGDKRIGVFASRSPFRPSAIGLSVLKLKQVVIGDHGRIRLEVCGQDIVDGTPILDIKPYLPYTDSVPTAVGGFAPTAPDADALPVTVSAEAENDFAQIAKRGKPQFRNLAMKVVSADPRPAYQHDAARVYKLDYAGCKAEFRVADGVLTVTKVEAGE